MRYARTAVLVGLAAVLVAGSAMAQVDFSKYIALGDSLTAGYASNSLVETYQVNSFPALLARQIGDTTFEQPLITDPGIPPVLVLQQLSIVGGQVSPVIVPKSQSFGQPRNATLPTPYDNLGIVGADVNDLLTKTGNILRLQQNPPPADLSQTIMFDLVLRNGTNTAIEQAIAAQGTFYTVWAGNNDVLGAALSGVALEGVTLTPVADFQRDYQILIGALRQNRPNARIVVANLPDVVAIPFVNTVKPYLINPANGQRIPLIGEAGLLTENDYLTLAASSLLAQGIGVPAAAGGTGQPLPEGGINPATGQFQAGVILRAAEVAAIRARTAEINQVIAAVAQQASVPLVDIHGFFNEVLEHGYVIGGVRLTPAFLTGGVFSYDGVHPQPLGYALVANRFIEVINEAFGTDVEPVDVREILLGARAATTVTARATVFSVDAWRSMLAVFAPDAVVPETTPARRPVSRRLGRSPAPGDDLL